MGHIMDNYILILMIYIAAYSSAMALRPYFKK